MARSKTVKTRDLDAFLKRNAKKEQPFKVSIGGKSYGVTAGPTVGYMLFVNQKKAEAIADGQVNDDGDPLFTVGQQLEIFSCLLRTIMGDGDFERWVLTQNMGVAGFRSLVAEIERLWVPEVPEDTGDVDPKADISSQEG